MSELNGHEKRIVRFEGVEVREAQGEGGPGEIHGYAAVFNQATRIWDFDEMIAPGAFARTLASNPDVRATIEHEGGLTTIGRTRNGTLSLAEDERGLRVQIRPPDTQAGRDTLTLVRDGYVDQMSFMFRPVLQEWSTGEDGTPLRQLTDIELDDGDVSIVTYPAYPQTSAEVRDKAKAVRQEATADDGDAEELARTQARRAARRRQIEILSV
jgi:HK97 family phage prohead protease